MYVHSYVFAGPSRTIKHHRESGSADVQACVLLSREPLFPKLASRVPHPADVEGSTAVCTSRSCSNPFRVTSVNATRIPIDAGKTPPTIPAGWPHFGSSARRDGRVLLRGHVRLPQSSMTYTYTFTVRIILTCTEEVLVRIDSSSHAAASTKTSESSEVGHERDGEETCVLTGRD